MANFIKFDPPAIADFVYSLEQGKAELSRNVDEALEAGAEEIANEQRRIILQKSFRLSGHIGVGCSLSTSTGKLYYETGYLGGLGDQTEVKRWVYGVVLEFGRPGKRNRGYIERKRKTKDGYKYIKERNGWIEEYSHIRRGFDNKYESAAEKVENAYNDTINKLGG